MKKIKLTQGKYVLVDDEDYEYLNQWSWYYGAGRKGNGYAVRTIGMGKDKRMLYMHRVIMGNPKNQQVDHRDINHMNNQKYNLRISTNAQNNQNKNKPKNNTSGLKGAYWHTQVKRWMSRIQVNGQDVYIGLFDTKEEAAYIYDQFALQLHGEFARTNFL